MRIFYHALVVIRLFQPLYALTDSSDSATCDLSIQAVVKAFVQVTLDVLFVLHHFDILVHLLEGSQNNSLSFCIELWTASSTKDLLNIKNANVFVCTSRGVVNFCALNQHGVRRQVDTPS